MTHHGSAVYKRYIVGTAIASCTRECLLSVGKEVLYDCHLHREWKTSARDADAGESLRGLLVALGHFAVRDSDDAEGFTGSDTVLMDDKPVYAGLLLAAQAEGTMIRTPDSLARGAELSIIQQAMIDAGIVQSAYNAPAAALLLTWLLEHKPQPTREDIKEVLSGIFIRDTGYEHYFLAESWLARCVTMVPIPRRYPLRSAMSLPMSQTESKGGWPAVGGWLEIFCGRSGGTRRLRVVMLRSPHAHGMSPRLMLPKPEDPGVVMIITLTIVLMCTICLPDRAIPTITVRPQAFQPKSAACGDRVAAFVAETEEQALAARQNPGGLRSAQTVFTVEEAMAPGAPVVQNGAAEYLMALGQFAEYNLELILVRVRWCTASPCMEITG